MKIDAECTECGGMGEVECSKCHGTGIRATTKSGASRKLKFHLDLYEIWAYLLFGFAVGVAFGWWVWG